MNFLNKFSRLQAATGTSEFATHANRYLMSCYALKWYGIIVYSCKPRCNEPLCMGNPMQYVSRTKKYRMFFMHEDRIPELDSHEN